MRARPSQVSRREEFGSLTAFTTLAPVAAGGLVGLLLIRGVQTIHGIDPAVLVLFLVGLAALVFSLFHLGRPWKAPLAILHLSTSWLSREVILFSLFLISLIAYAFVPIFDMQASTLYFIGLSCTIIGLAATVATGKTYQLRSRPSWDNWPAILSFPLGALTTGLLFGFFTAYLFSGTTELGTPSYSLILGLLILTIIVSILRTLGVHHNSIEQKSSRSLVVGHYMWFFVLRIFAVVLTMVMIFTHGTALYFAWIPALIGEFADRFLFFNTVRPVTFTNRYS